MGRLGYHHDDEGDRAVIYFVDDDVPEQHPARLGLHRLRVDGQQVIAEEALLIVPDPVGFESVLPAGDAGAGPRVPGVA